MAFLSSKSGQFAYFAAQLGTRNWGGKDVLDFGGNIGNILRDPQSTIDQSHYWCIDVVREAIEKGRSLYPSAHWLYYDRHSFAFNPDGVPGLRIPPIEQRFDFIVAYSVFTSTPRDEMEELVGQLRSLLKGDGVLAFSFIDPHFRPWPSRYDGCNLKWRLERSRAEGAEIDVAGLVAKLGSARWCTLKNGGSLYVEDDRASAEVSISETSCHVFYSAIFMKSLYPEAEILCPVSGEMQHCCVLRK
jgi:SAM-dependent methyltransferase